MIVERPALERRVLEALDAGRIPVVLGGCGTGRTSLLLRLAGLLGSGRGVYLNFAAAATTPERCLQAILRATPASVTGERPAADGGETARGAFDALAAFLDAAVAPGGGPVTFLIDEILDIRTFESFPGLRHVQREIVDRLAASPNGFVLASRFTARAHRLLRDATARFEVIHVPSLDADEVAGLARQRGNTPAWSAEESAVVAALSGGRATYARVLIDTSNARGGGTPDALRALTSAMTPDGALTALCRESYEFRLHRARGYGALKAILDVLAEEEPLTLTEIALRLHRTPGSTKDYLSWLEDVDLVTSQRKRYSFDDPLLRLHVRLHGKATPPTTGDIAREVDGYAASRLPRRVDAPAPEPVLAVAERTVDRSGIIEID